MPTIDPTLYLHNQPQERTPSPDLGKEEFLNILMTQLQYQDPLDPLDDREFISQMTTFSSLEQMMNMASALDKLVHHQTFSPVIEYSHLIGKEVTYEVIDQGTGESIEEKTSQVIAVNQEQDHVLLALENDELVEVETIIQVKNPAENK